jgi:thioredoxin-like negative regulator of GroEL
LQAPEWDLAATTLANENSPVKLAKVDTVEATKVYKKYEISSFPTIIFFKNRREVPYKGARNADAIVSWVKKHSSSPVKTIETIDGLIEAQQSTDVVVLGYFPDLSTGVMRNKRDAFFQIAESVDHLDFYETSEESVAVYINLLDEDRIDKAHIFVLKAFDKHLITEQPLQLERKMVTESIMADYVKHHSYELFPEFSRDSAKRIFAPRIMVCLLILHILKFISLLGGEFDNDTRCIV